jgi:hypothetical protein
MFLAWPQLPTLEADNECRSVVRKNTSYPRPRSSSKSKTSRQWVDRDSYLGMRAQSITGALREKNKNGDCSTEPLPVITLNLVVRGSTSRDKQYWSEMIRLIRWWVQRARELKLIARSLLSMKQNKVQLSLQSSSPSVLIVTERKRRDIVIGAPHHAPAGIPNLPCIDHPMSDENVGYLTDYLGERLNCCSIIACNYIIDANKCLDTDYAVQIAKWNPETLIEIHGHAGKQPVGPDVIEISCGSLIRNEFSVTLEKELNARIAQHRELGELIAVGDFRRLKFPATRSATIVDKRRLAYHLELPPKLRKSRGKLSGPPPETGFAFCRILADALGAIGVART